MVWNGRIYFASDRDGVMNIWSMTPTGKDLRQHTHHTDFDVQSPSLDHGQIVYQHGADLRVLDVSTNQEHLLSIRLTSDLDQMRETWVKNPFSWTTAAHLSPDGTKVALTARGEVFVAPVKPGRLVQATRKKSNYGNLIHLARLAKRLSRSRMMGRSCVYRLLFLRTESGSLIQTRHITYISMTPQRRPISASLIPTLMISLILRGHLTANTLPIWSRLPTYLTN